MTQGYPLEMIACSIEILPLIKKTKWEITEVTHPWYDDRDQSLGTFSIIETYFNCITRKGPGCGYHPELPQSVLIVHPENPEAKKVFGVRHRFKVCTGARYLGNYIRDDRYKINWLRECTLMWDKNIGKIRKTTDKRPRNSYIAAACAIQ